ncbi:hypothetical protein BCR42DRAFT_416803, partial [Absidia repens]
MTFKKQVHFSGNIEWVDTFGSEVYDRTALQVAKLSYHDMYELLVMKSQWREESRMMMVANVENGSSGDDERQSEKRVVDDNDDTEEDDDYGDHDETEPT